MGEELVAPAFEAFGALERVVDLAESLDTVEAEAGGDGDIEIAEALLSEEEDLAELAQVVIDRLEAVAGGAGDVGGFHAFGDVVPDHQLAVGDAGADVLHRAAGGDNQAIFLQVLDISLNALDIALQQDGQVFLGEQAALVARFDGEALQAALAHVDLTVLGRGGFVFLAVFLVEHGEEHLDHLAGFEGLAGAFRGADAQEGHLAGLDGFEGGVVEEDFLHHLDQCDGFPLTDMAAVSDEVLELGGGLLDRGAALAVFGFVGNLDGHRRLSLLSGFLLFQHKSPTQV